MALRSLTSRRTRTSSGARQKHLGQLVPQQGVAGKAATPTDARRTNPTFMGRLSALLLQSTIREQAGSTNAVNIIARSRVHVKHIFSQCYNWFSIWFNIEGVLPSSIRAFKPGNQMRAGLSRVCRRASKSSRVWRGRGAASSPSCKLHRDARPRQSAVGRKFSVKARKKKGLWGPIAPRVGARRRRKLYGCSRRS